MKRVSNGGKDIVTIPSVVEPIEVEVPLVITLVEDEDIPVAVGILHIRAHYHLRHCPLNALRAVSHLGRRSPPVFCTK